MRENEHRRVIGRLVPPPPAPVPLPCAPNGAEHVAAHHVRAAWLHEFIAGGCIIATLDAHPYRSVVTDPATGSQRAIAITGRDVLAVLARLASNSPQISLFPTLVAQFKAGEYGFVNTYVTQTLSVRQSVGMSLSVTCADRARIDVRRGLHQLLANHPEYEAVPTGLFGACPAWPVRPVPRAFNEPVTSTIPTLVLAGEWDHATPTKWARRAAEHLSRSHLVELPGLGHAVTLANPCGQSLLKAFVAQPDGAPDTTCIHQLPEPAWN
jgi:pimeloyl-ACP methyl ester carboxylesterase